MEKRQPKVINNAFYNDLNEMWIDSDDHPIALLRAENALRNPWIQSVLVSVFPYPAKVLDIGCGGGLLTNFLAQKGHFVHGIDLSSESLALAKKKDTTKSVDYQRASAYELPFKGQVFDAVCAMDLLEHVEKPEQVVEEASRLLKKGGVFFFHTFNRNLFSYLMVIKGIEWCFANAPKNMHVYPLFIKPKEIKSICRSNRLKVEKIKGVAPQMRNKAFWKMVLTRKVDESFRFVFTSSLKAGYSGYALRI